MIGLPKQNTPKWLVFATDIIISFLALMIAYFIRFDTINFPVKEELDVFKTGLPIYLGVRALSFFIFSTHRGIIRHTSVEDIKKVALAVTVGTAVMIVISTFKANFGDGFFLFPSSIIMVEYFVCIFLLVVYRFSIKLIYLEELKNEKDLIPTVIYGAGIYGVITKHTLEKEAGIAGKIVCFIDDNPKKWEIRWKV